MSITKNEERSYAHLTQREAVPSNTFSITKRSSDDLNVSIENIFSKPGVIDITREIFLCKRKAGDHFLTISFKINSVLLKTCTVHQKNPP